MVLYLSISIALLTAWAFQKRSRPQQLTLCWSFHAETLQATASEGLAQGPYVTARAGFDPATLWSKGIDSTNAPPCPIIQSLPSDFSQMAMYGCMVKLIQSLICAYLRSMWNNNNAALIKINLWFCESWHTGI